MSTKANLQAAWCRWTGEPLPEARQRIRALAEAQLLPTWRNPISYEDLGRLLLGFVASVQHKDAPEAVRRFSEFRGMIRGRGADAEPLLHAFKDKPLIEALTLALQPEFWLLSVEANVTRGWCLLKVVRCPKHVGWVSEEVAALAEDPPGTLRMLFTDPSALPLPAAVHPLEIKRSLTLPLFLNLLVDLMGHSLPDGSVQTESADPSPKESAPFKHQGLAHAHKTSDVLASSERNARTRVSSIPTATSRSPPCAQIPMPTA